MNSTAINLRKSLAAAVFSLTMIPAVGSAASAGSVNLSYCDGEITSSGLIKVAGEETVEAAIYLPSELLSIYKGNAISAVNAGLASKLSLTGLTVWVRSELNGENIATGTCANGSIAKGWNAVALDEAWDITGETGVYVGYTYTQKKSTYAISTVGEYEKYGLYVRLGKDAEWTEPEEYGVLSIEAVVTGEALPNADVALSQASMPWLYAIDRPMKVDFTVKNLGIDDLGDFILSAEIPETGERIERLVECNLKSGESLTSDASFEFESLRCDSDYTVVLTADMPNGESDCNPYNGVIELEFHTIRTEYNKMTVIEEFTTEMCSNCPRVADWLHQMTEEMTEDEASKVAIACHHAGYYTDWLTKSADQSYLWLYNDGYNAYAPALMVDRMRQPGTDTPVFLPGSLEELTEKVRRNLGSPAFVDVNITAHYDPETYVITAHIDGERSFIADGSVPRITVYALEDNVKAQHQAGADGDFYHNHVLRALNSTWGDILEWDGDTYSYDCTLSIDQFCDTDNMYLLAFVNDYDPADPNACEILNANRQDFSDFSGAGVDSLVDNEEPGTGKVTIYSLTGAAVSETSIPSGLYIVTTEKNGVRSSKKMFMK